MKRKLVAILSADVKGYSRLMEDDEEATVATLTAYRDVFTTAIEKHGGRVVDSPGDNLLAEFASVVDAMRGSVEIQEELRARNADLPDHRRMEFRIGINLGDVIEEEGRLYGDGVNIAARVESLADPGGISVSGTAYDHLKNKLSIGSEFMGEHAVKNISEPVPVYRLLTEPGVAPRKAWNTTIVKAGLRWAVIVLAGILVIGVGAFLTRNPSLELSPAQLAPASVERMALPLPEKPSIAVLPFVNIGSSPEQGYIADGISENIIAALAKIPQMFVISRNSTFSYKGKSAEVQQVAEELGVRNVLEGSVQQSGERIRVTAQLIDAVTGRHIWAEMYDRRAEDLFDLLDGITMEIVVALQVKLTEGDQARVRQDTESLEAMGKWVKAANLWERFNRGDNDKARVLLEGALAIDPEYTSAWARLGHVYYSEARFGWSAVRDESIERAEALAEKALAMDPSHPEANALMGHVHLLRRAHDDSVAWVRKAVAFGPNDAAVHAMLGVVLRHAGEPEEAIRLLTQAMRLQPVYPGWYLWNLGASYRQAGRLDEAIATFEQLLHTQWGLSGQTNARLGLASSYALSGRITEARSQIVELQKTLPAVSVEWLTRYLETVGLLKDPAWEQQLILAYRKASLPEHPPQGEADLPPFVVHF